MKPILLSILLAAVASPVLHAEPLVIPRPADCRERQGEFVLHGGALVAAPAGVSEMYLETLAQAAGFRLKSAPADARGAIQFLSERMLPDNVPIPEGEGYVIRITPQVINVHAATPAGMFYGMQTLAQLIDTVATHDVSSLSLPAMDIVDSPRFAWRGYMLDESRHFTGVDGVKRLLDAMARYKLNRLHWHLTDSPAWRIEIAKYPQLTASGARGDETDRRPDAPARFYTRAQIKEIVAYARERHIIVVPEIDMPGHADAATTAYPEHDGGGMQQNGKPGKWPHFTFNPARPATLAFLDDILKEVAGMFPDAGVIHYGGDEVNFGWGKWTELPDVKELMKRENLADAAAVESWFSRRMAATINSLGFKTGGWDEIAGRKLPADRTLVFWWRHDKPQALRQALDAGYAVVLCPRRPCYFDFVQHESHGTGRRWGGFNPLSDVYDFPAPLKLSAADEKKVVGMQACLWTETTVTQERRDFMTWPRLIALAESAWTPAARKDFTSFQTRLAPQHLWLRKHGIGYYDVFANSPEVTDRGAKSEYLDKPR